MIKSLAHTAYVATDMEKSLHFYCEVLGLKNAFELRDENGKPWIHYLKVTDGQFIELFYGKPELCPTQSYSHLCLEVDDIHAIAAQLTAKGVTLDSQPSQGVDHNWQCWAKDPDGNRIEFMQMTPECPQNNC